MTNTTEADIGILKVRVEDLIATVSEVKSWIQRIEEAVGVVKIVQVHADQQSSEYEKLTAVVKDLSNSITVLEDVFEKDLYAAQTKCSSKLSDLENVGLSRESKWKEKYDTFRGIIIGITLLGGMLSGFSAYFAASMSSKLEESFRYVQQLKTLDTLDVVKNHFSGHPK